ncbi:ammonium transporter [Chytriomyces hyalinus]|nr:ammonium transporter [Chytriomyces hyalinus]
MHVLHSVCIIASSIAVLRTSALPLLRKDTPKLPGFYIPDAVEGPAPAKASSLVGDSPKPMNLTEATAAAQSYIVSSLGLQKDDIEISFSHSSDDELHHIYATQKFQGLPIVNAVSNVNIDAKTGEILSMHHSFVPEAIMKVAVPVSRRDAPVMPADEAVKMFSQAKGFSSLVGDTLSVLQDTERPNGMIVNGSSMAEAPIRASQKYYQTQKGLIHVWDLNVPMTDLWQNAFIDSASGEVAGVSTWTSDVVLDTRPADSLPSQPNPVQNKPKQTKKRRSGNKKRSGVSKSKSNCKRPSKGGNNKPKPTPPQPAPAPAPQDPTPDPAPVPQRPVPAPAPQPIPAPQPVPAPQPAPQPGPQPAPQPGPGRQPAGVRPATYKVVPIGKNSPAQNQGLTFVNSPWDLNASPNGWHKIGNRATNDLSGNNVIAQANPNNVRSPQQLVRLPRPIAQDLQFNIAFNPNTSPKQPQNRDAATVNMFYVSNACHDIFYNYGFTEAAGNFQTDNGNKGGRGNDAVIANNQDGSGVNNANFATPPDGQPGLMRMYLFNSANPNRDGAYENDIIIHEMAHGLSNRLTGGPANSNCLNNLQAGGMGEGWGDMLAAMLSMPATSTRQSDYAMGVYATNSARGIRRYPYSTNMRTNPRTYGDLRRLNEVHDIGEVWAATLYEVMWFMVDTSGFIAPQQIVSGQASGKGNSDMMHLLIGGMKMQPCNPTMIQARNAILAADKAKFRGKYACDIWNGFAKRGMGANAVDNRGFANNFDLPAGCRKKF